MLKKEDLSFQSFTYQSRWTYGSEQEDKRKNGVRGVEKTGDRTYRVSLEDFHPGRVYQLDVDEKVKSKEWKPIQNSLFYYTANEVPEG
ncbi:MAG: protease II [Akkermansiaceae bacterium]|jgi:protease II